MKKTIIYVVSVFILLIVWYGEKRKIYCINGTCITVWKTFGNTCYIVPGKYYGLIKPMDDYIRSTNTNSFTIYISMQLPKTLIIKNEGTSQGFEGEFDIINDDKSKFIIKSYSKTYEDMLYHPKAAHFNDLRDDANYFAINVEEDYAEDKNGKKL